MDYNYLTGQHVEENHLTGFHYVLSHPLQYIVAKSKASDRKKNRTELAQAVEKDNTMEILKAYGILSGKKTTQNPMTGAGGFSFDPRKKKKTSAKKDK